MSHLAHFRSGRLLTPALPVSYIALGRTARSVFLDQSIYESEISDRLGAPSSTPFDRGRDGIAGILRKAWHRLDHPAPDRDICRGAGPQHHSVGQSDPKDSRVAAGWRPLEASDSRSMPTTWLLAQSPPLRRRQQRIEHTKCPAVRLWVIVRWLSGNSKAWVAAHELFQSLHLCGGWDCPSRPC